MATNRRRTETGKTSARKAVRKPSLKKETLRDLVPASEAAVKGGRMNTKTTVITGTCGCT